MPSHQSVTTSLTIALLFGFLVAGDAAPSANSPARIDSLEEILASTKQVGGHVATPYVPNPALKDMSQPLVEQLGDLKETAKNDVSTAYDLARALSICAGAPVDDHLVEGLLQSDRGGAEAAARVLDVQAYCVGLEGKDFQRAIELVDTAAASGLLEAQLGYVDIVGGIIVSRPEFQFDDGQISSYKKKSLSYLAAASRHGNDDALARLAQVYDDGAIVDRDPATAARLYREFLRRSGSNSPGHLRYLQLLERRATELNGD